MSSETPSSLLQYAQALFSSDASSDAQNHGPAASSEPAPPDGTALSVRAVVSSVPFPAAAVTEDTRIVAVNASYPEFFGTSRVKLQGTRLDEIDAIPGSVVDSVTPPETHDIGTTVDVSGTVGSSSQAKATIKTTRCDPELRSDPPVIIQTVVPHADLISTDATDAASQDSPVDGADSGHDPRSAEDKPGVRESQQAVAEEVEAVAAALRRGKGTSGDIELEATFETGVVADNLVPAIREYAADTSQSLHSETDVIETAGAIADTGETLASDIREQSGILADSVADAQTLAGRMNTVAQRATETSEAASEAATRASKGTKIVSETQAVATDAVEATTELETIVERTVKRMEAIEDTVDVIEDIADKTNMLALNANIEAARAASDDDTGGTDGFAVVANEVKQLANDTQSRTDDIVESLEDLRACINEVAATTESVESYFSTADQRLSDVNVLFTEIADAVDTVADGIEDVSSENEAQAADIDEITARIEEAQAICETNQMMVDELVDDSDTMIDELT